MERTYTCEGCGTQFTGTADAAFDLGWDTPERFLSHCTCPRCPITSTAWWKAMVEKNPLTDDEVDRIRGFNAIHETAQGSAGSAVAYTTETLLPGVNRSDCPEHGDDHFACHQDCLACCGHICDETCA